MEKKENEFFLQASDYLDWTKPLPLYPSDEIPGRVAACQPSNFDQDIE